MKSSNDLQGERPFVPVGAQVVRVLRNGEEVFPAMLEAIETAQRRVCIEMYWWAPDAIGLRFRDALVAARKRSVDVSVVVDGFGSLSLPDAFWNPLREAGGRVAIFRPFAWPRSVRRLQNLFLRDHRKIVVADDHAFVGGLNFTKEWLSRADGGEDWRDTALEVRGANASTYLAGLVEGVWGEASGSVRGAAHSTIYWDAAQQLGIFSNRPAVRRGRSIRRAYFSAVRSAQKSIDIVVAYFAPRPMFLRALARATRRGVRVRLLVPQYSDVELARYASQPALRWLTERGVQVFAYRHTILHAKSATVDGEWCTVGSHNLDGLSWALNLECNLVLRSAGVAAQLTALFEEDMGQSKPWSSETSLLERIIPARLIEWYTRGQV